MSPVAAAREPKFRNLDDLLQHRMHITTPTAELLEQVPVAYVLFDLLHRKDRSLLELSYGRRRELLDRLDLERPGLLVPANFTGVGGDVVLAAVAQQTWRVWSRKGWSRRISRGVGRERGSRRRSDTQRR